jgi:predicted molibdopterin-dependent oxidoreductase YjgC
VTARELRLRTRIDVLTRQRDRYVAVLEAREEPPRPPAPVTSRCVYCGWPCRTRACADHRDLIRLDPHYEGTG